MLSDAVTAPAIVADVDDDGARAIETGHDFVQCRVERGHVAPRPGRREAPHAQEIEIADIADPSPHNAVVAGLPTLALENRVEDAAPVSALPFLLTYAAYARERYPIAGL